MILEFMQDDAPLFVCGATGIVSSILLAREMFWAGYRRAVRDIEYRQRAENRRSTSTRI